MINSVITSKYCKNGTFLRRIQSFVSRNRKLSDSQSNFISMYWPKFGIDFSQFYINIDDYFHFHFPLILEIGFGVGDSLLRYALRNPSKNFIGIEVYLPGIVSCLKHINFHSLKNVRIIYHDAVEVLNNMICDKTLHEIQIFFPDPWPKRRHRKRRIFTKMFARLILKKLVFNGILHISTDCQSYAEEIVSIVHDISGYSNLSNSNSYISRPKFRPFTKFEKKAIRFNNSVFDLMFKSV
ncbi:hypothetical protein XW81_02555 [Buchnera aphidicola (Schlechtendalia chinensis)]|uniref:tRNA (guanine-N(7)-)-methyltransferase n=1 Tax=Buchnera aphidicola subsp. Schlechtendalia chinensis TaxID=118110 RepID=A0A172WE52_BUCSC|nr:tRNA (guanosine(46)-N7)-methyltransferase TrmB [Buchnera aphidicola]ANF17253.1 hypothetical protein XW81_02555 [Buchnera aphidicola (Schlechtendalia chinensis)]